MKERELPPFVASEIDRIVEFIRGFVMEGERVVVPVSGGLDSDIVARLCCKSLGAQRVKLFIVVQSQMEKKFLKNARGLAQELAVSLAEIHLERTNLELVKALEAGEHQDLFRADKLIDPAKAKCSVRSAVISCYQDKGFLVAGTTNKSEKELGFFLTFGDNLAHFKPIAHLYKSQLAALAAALGTRPEVISQEPSSGFWEGQTDREDLAYWILNDGPILCSRDFSKSEEQRALKIADMLTQEKIDLLLQLYAAGSAPAEILARTDWPAEIVNGLIHIVEKAKILKNRTILVEMQRE